jgi:hypothetical protein
MTAIEYTRTKNKSLKYCNVEFNVRELPEERCQYNHPPHNHKRTNTHVRKLSKEIKKMVNMNIPVDVNKSHT